MSLGNDTMMWNLVQLGITISDNQSLAATGQTAAVRVIGQAYRVTKSVANGSCVLGSRLSGEGNELTIVINDSANTIVVWTWPNENMSGVLNSNLSIPAGQSGIFFPVPVAVPRAGLANTNPIDWRCAVVP